MVLFRGIHNWQFNTLVDHFYAHNADYLKDYTAPLEKMEIRRERIIRILKTVYGIGQEAREVCMLIPYPVKAIRARPPLQVPCIPVMMIAS